ncbi:hypothetical protein SAMN05661091_4616 [Paenibacillus uliginis N3/975]|uniref:Uncharacterized protein n=1 Tax=Paenibacillus uliginis N3/975 TaxID=1313296 RepID=A0A1X7HML0_9BACL|nr:hypothetical protein [Paenibacillus uliginis]SMF89352.1 hypothetical protein SAMN05661091_4616 [Paenibacillus uliginis N3/975]
MLLEAIKMIGEIIKELFQGGMPVDRLWWLIAAVILAVCQELASLWKKGKLKASEMMTFEVIKGIGFSILAVGVIVAKFLLILTLLGQWLPGLGLPEEKHVIVWYAAVSICITVVIHPLIHWFFLTEQKLLRISLLVLHTLLITAVLGWIADLLEPGGLISVQGRLTLGMIMSAVMLVLTTLEREMVKKEKTDASALGIGEHRIESGSG